MQNNTQQTIEEVVNDLISSTDDEEKASKLSQLCQMCGQIGEAQLMDAVMQLAYLEVDTSVKIRQLWCAFLVKASISAQNQVMLIMAQECCVRHFDDESKLVVHGALHSAGLLAISATQIILQKKDVEVKREMREMLNEVINKLLTVAEDVSKLSTAIHALEECKQIVLTLTASHITVFNQCVGTSQYTGSGQGGGNSVNFNKEANSILMRICNLLKRPNAAPQVSLTLIRILCEMAQERPTQYANQIVPCLLDYANGSSIFHQQSIVAGSLKRQLKEGIISLLKNRDPVLKSWQKDLMEVMNRFQFKTDADAAIRYRKKKEYREQQQLQQGSRKKKAEDGLVKEQRKSKQPRLDKKQSGISSQNATSPPSKQDITNGQPSILPSSYQQQGQDGIQDAQVPVQSQLIMQDGDQNVNLDDCNEDGIKAEGEQQLQSKSEQFSVGAFNVGDAQQAAQIVQNNSYVDAQQSAQFIETNSSVNNPLQDAQNDSQNFVELQQQHDQQQLQQQMPQQQQQLPFRDSENELQENNLTEENGDQVLEIVESDPLHVKQEDEVELDEKTRQDLEKMRQAAREEVQRQRRFQQQKLQNNLDGYLAQDPRLIPDPRLNQQIEIVNSERFQKLSKQSKPKAKDLNQKVARKLQKKLKGEELTTEDESDRNEQDVYQNDFVPQQLQQQVPFDQFQHPQFQPSQHMFDMQAPVNEQFGVPPPPIPPPFQPPPFISQNNDVFFVPSQLKTYNFFNNMSIGEVMQQLFGFMEGVDQSNIHMDIFDVVPDLTQLVNSIKVDVAADIVLDLLNSLPNNEVQPVRMEVDVVPPHAHQEIVLPPQQIPNVPQQIPTVPQIPFLDPTNPMVSLPPQVVETEDVNNKQPPPPPLPPKKKQLTEKDEFKIRALTIRSKKATKFESAGKKEILAKQLTTVLAGQWSTLERCWQRLQNSDEIIKTLTRNSINTLEKKKDKQTIQKITESLNSIVAGLATTQPDDSLNLVVYQNCLSDILNWMLKTIQPVNFSSLSNPLYIFLSNIIIVPFHQVPDFFNKVVEQDDWVEVVLQIADNLIMERWPQSKSMLEWILEVTQRSSVKIRQRAIEISVKLYQFSKQQQQSSDEEEKEEEDDDKSIGKPIQSAAEGGLEQVIEMQSSVVLENDKIAVQDLLEGGRLMHLFVDLVGSDSSLLHLLFQYFAKASEMGRKLILQAKLDEERVALEILLQNVQHKAELVKVVQSFPEGSEELVEHIGLTLSKPNVEPVISQDLALAYWNLYLQQNHPKWTIPTVAYLSEVLVQRDRESQLVKEWTSLDQYRFNLLLQRLYSNPNPNPNPNPNSAQKGWAILPQDLIYDLIMISNDPQFQPLSKVTQAVLMCLQNYKSVFSESILANVLHRIVYRNERPTLLMWLTMHVFQNFPNLRRTIQNDYVRKLMNEPRVQLNLVLWRGILLFHLNNQLFDELLSIHDALFQSHVWDWRADGNSKEQRDNQNLRNQLLSYLESRPKIVQQLSLAKKRTMGWQGYV